MNVTVVGATGRIGAQVTELLTVAGHRVTAASRASGVDAAIGTGVVAALANAEVVVDVLDSPSTEHDVALAFFTGASANLSIAAKRAGVRHYVLLSASGADTADGGYLRGKALQESTIAASGLAYTIIRASPSQPDTAAAVARIATESPANDVIELDG